MEDQVTFQFVPVKQTRENRSGITYSLTLRQQPKQSRMCGVGEKADRRPIDPPPIVQLRVDDSNLPPSDQNTFLQNPYYFMYASLMAADLDEEVHLLRDGKTRSTTGSVVSSLYHLKDIDNRDAGFFVFPDLSVRMEGTYRLKLSLFEIVGKDVYHCRSIISQVFVVYSAKKFPGMEESTYLSRTFADQGLKIRIRKESRQRPKLGRRKGQEGEVSEDRLESSTGKRSKREQASLPEGRHHTSDSASDRQVPFVPDKSYEYAVSTPRSRRTEPSSSALSSLSHTTHYSPYSGRETNTDRYLDHQPHSLQPFVDMRTAYSPQPSPTGELLLMRNFQEPPAMPDRVNTLQDNVFGRPWDNPGQRMYPGGSDWHSSSSLTGTHPAKLLITPQSLSGEQAPAHRDYFQNNETRVIPSMMPMPREPFTSTRYSHAYSNVAPLRHNTSPLVRDQLSLEPKRQGDDTAPTGYL